MDVACIQLHKRKMLTNKTTAPGLSFHGLKLHGTAALGFPVSWTTNACAVKPEYLCSCIMGHQLLVYLDDVNLLLLTVKKNKAALVVASVEGGNKTERMKDMFMSFEQCEGQIYSLKITKTGLGKCGNFKYLGKTLTNKYCKREGFRPD